MSEQVLVNPQYKKRREQLGIAHLPYQPIGDRILVKRIVQDKYGGKDGMIHKPDRYKGTETRGLLCAAGPQALDGLVGGHGTLLGDVIWIARYVDWEESGWIYGRIEELAGSEDLIARLHGRNDKGGVNNDEALTAKDVGGAVVIDLDTDGNYIFKFGE